jgi:hypothetical protein
MGWRFPLSEQGFTYTMYTQRDDTSKNISVKQHAGSFKE